MPGVVARGLLLCLLWLAVCAGPAAAAPGWAPAQPVGTGFTGGVTLAADLTPAGAATVVWWGEADGDEAILASSRPPGGDFTIPEPISRATTELGRPALAVSRHGVAIATWAEKTTTGTGRWIVHAAVRSSDGVWSPPEPLSNESSSPPEPRAAIADDGQAVVIWVGAEITDAGVKVAHRSAAGTWSVGQTIGQGGEPHVVMDRQGNATALWTGSPLMTADRPAGGTWSTPKPLDAGGGSTPHLAVGPDGGVAAIWQSGEVEAAVRPRGGSWSAPETVGTPIGSYAGERPQIALDGAGTATAVFGGTGLGIRTNRRPAGGSWAPVPEPLTTPYYTEIYWPAVVAHPSGFTLISYLGAANFNPSEPGVQIVHAALRLPGAPWIQPVDIGRPGGVVGIDIDDAGHALVAWVGHPGGEVNARAYDPAGPELTELDVPPTGVASEELAFTVTPQDRWSEPGATTWDFGDGTSASGTDPTHAYAAPGRYTVRVTSADALGNATSEERVVDVAPGPPSLELETVRFARATYRRSRLSKKAQVRVQGTISAPLRVSVRLTGPLRPRGRERTVVLGARDLPAGAFSERFRLRRSLVAKMLPGTYALEVTGPELEPAMTWLELRAPPQGVVMAHKISLSRTGPNLLRVTNVKRLWATFTFAPDGAARRKLRVRWYAPGRRAPVGSFPVKRAFSWWENPAGLAKGRWRCVLVSRGRVVDSVSIRVG